MRIVLIIGVIINTCFSSFALKITSLSELNSFVEKSSDNPLRITEIDLSNQGIEVFPEAILKCENLEILDLSNNGIVNLPTEMGSLKKLQKLNLSSNQGLSFLDLGLVFKESLFRLKELNLKDCEMGHLPREIGMQNQIKKLNVSGNLLNNLPYPIIRLSKMEELNASNNRIEDITWQVHQWWGLKRLDISNNQEMNSQELVFALSTLDHLDYLSISHLNEMPKEIKDLNVDELIISESKIDRFIRNQVSSKIRKLGFISCEFKDPEKVAETIEEFVQPEYLQFNNISRVALSYFMGIRSDIDSVDIRSNGLTDIKPLLKVSGIKWVDARLNSINEASREAFAERDDITLLASEPVNPMVGVQPPIEKFAPKPVQRMVTAGQDTKIALGNATFDFKQNSFVDKNGSVYTGEAVLSYTEYRNPADILFSGITMTIDEEGETLPFSSAGMFNLTATDDSGNDLEINPAAPVEVNMMRNNADTAVSLYALNADGVWEYRGKDQIEEPFKIDMEKVDSAGNSAFLNYKDNNVIITSNRFVPKLEMINKDRSFALNFKELATNSNQPKIWMSNEDCYIKAPGAVASLIANTTFYYDGDRDSLAYYKSFLKKVQRKSRMKYRRFSSNKLFSLRGKKYSWGISYVSKLDLTHDKTNDRFTLKFMFKDSLVRIPVVLNPTGENQKQRIRSFAKYADKLNTLRKADEKERILRANSAARIIQGQQGFIKELAREREKNRQLALKRQWDMANGAASPYSVSSSFRISGFGVWNCDQIGRMERPVVVPAVLTDEEGNKISDSLMIESIAIVDHDKNGVFSYGGRQGAMYDAASKKVTIVVFFSGLVMGVYHNWKNFTNGNSGTDKNENVPSDQLRLRQFNYSNMTAETASNLILQE